MVVSVLSMMSIVAMIEWLCHLRLDRLIDNPCFLQSLKAVLDATMEQIGRLEDRYGSCSPDSRSPNKR
jgi:hypothetical protein